MVQTDGRQCGFLPPSAPVPVLLCVAVGRVSASPPQSVFAVLESVQIRVSWPQSGANMLVLIRLHRQGQSIRAKARCVAKVCLWTDSHLRFFTYQLDLVHGLWRAQVSKHILPVPQFKNTCENTSAASWRFGGPRDRDLRCYILGLGPTQYHGEVMSEAYSLRITSALGPNRW